MKPFICHPKERLNIVSNKDRIIGVRSRKEIHENNLLHREVAVMAFNRKKELLLSKVVQSDLWDVSCGGHLKAGAGYMETALAEIKEELGLKVARKDVKKLFKYHTDDPCFNPTNNRFIQVFRLVCDEGDIKMGKELKRLKFFSVGELKKRIRKNKNQFSSRLLEIFARMRL